MGACPGLFRSIDEVLYVLPSEQGWAMAHNQMLAEGLPTLWPRRSDNKDGRWWDRLMGWWRKRRQSAS